MPVVPIDKDGDAVPGEADVGSAALPQLAVEPEPGTQSMQGSSKHQLRLGIGLPSATKMPSCLCTHPRCHQVSLRTRYTLVTQGPDHRFSEPWWHRVADLSLD